MVANKIVILAWLGASSNTSETLHAELAKHLAGMRDMFAEQIDVVGCVEINRVSPASERQMLRKLSMTRMRE